MSFYSELRDGLAKDLIAQFNTGAVVFLRPGATLSGGDPLNPFAGASETSTPRNAIVTGYSADEIAGAILAGDKKIIIDAADLSTPPAGDDFCTIDGVRHAIVSIEAKPAAGDVIVYVIQARTAGAG